MFRAETPTNVEESGINFFQDDNEVVSQHSFEVRVENEFELKSDLL